MMSGSAASLVGLRNDPLIEAYSILDEVVTSGSMSRAAWSLDLDVSIVSRQIARLERTFDCTLFERHRRGVRVTEAGALVADHVRRILLMYRRLRQEMDELRELRSGSIRIAATDGAIAGPLATVMSAFARRHPGLQIEVFRASSEQVVPALHRGDAELGAGLEIRSEPGIEIVGRLPDILAAVMLPTHRLARRRHIGLAELEAEALGTFERNSGVGRVLHRVAGGSGKPRLSLITNSLEALRHLAESGAGVALMCPHAISRDLKDRRLVAVPVQVGGQRVSLNLDFCVLRGARRSFALAAFIVALVEGGGGVQVVEDEVRPSRQAGVGH